MKQMERQILSYYIKQIACSTFEPEDERMFFSQIAPLGSELFGIDLQEQWHHRESNEKMEHLRRVFQERTTVHDLFHQDSPDVPKMDSMPSDPKIDALVRAFALPKKCEPLLRLLIYKQKIPGVRNLYRAVTGSRGFRDVFLVSDYEAIAALTGLEFSDVEDNLSSAGAFIDRGILADNYGDLKFNPRFLKLLDQGFSTSNQIINHLIGSPQVTTLTPDDFSYLSHDFDMLKNILSSALKTKQRGVNILLYGHPGCGKTELAKVLCQSIGAKLYATSDKNSDKDHRMSDMAQVQSILQRFRKSVIVFDEAEDVFSFNPFTRNAPSKLFLNRRLETNVCPVIWITNNMADMDSAFVRRFSAVLNVPDPDTRARMNTWRSVMTRHNITVSDEQISDLTRRFDVPVALIDTAAKNAKLTGDNTIIEYTLDNLHRALTGRSAKNVSDEVFNTELLNTDTDLIELANRIKDQKLTRFSMCLYGAPGTGKTAFANHLGQVLGMPIIKKRVSDIQSMYVGETEKNIARAFDEANRKKAILVFDEADSFLRSRQSAHRSWEVSHVNEMLTQMESAQYPFICTTNLMSSLDTASLRRFLFKVKYDYLTPSQVVLAFRHFFNLNPDASRISHLTHLAPGDFAVVSRQAQLLGITEEAELIRRLESEQNQKPEAKHVKIGF